MARVLVTGANGHVGCNTVRALLSRGHEPIAFVRRNGDLRGLNGVDVELRYGDVLDRASLNAALAGCEALIHSAAVYRLWCKNPDDILEPATVGTANALHAARDRGVRRVVYTSSIVAVGYSKSPNEVRTESDWNDEPLNPYYAAKTRSERDARRLAAELGVEMVTLCPAVVIGPSDYRVTPSNEIIRGMMNGKGVSWNGGLNVVDARDVGAAHAAAIDRGTPGERYILAGSNVSGRELAEMVTAITGKPVKHFGGGRGVARVLGTTMETVSRLFGRRPPISWTELHPVIERWGYFDGARAESVLGFHARPASESVRDAVNWLVDLEREGAMAA